MKFYCTFGQKSPFKNGWVEIHADSFELAKMFAFEYIGIFSMIYSEAEMNFDLFPQGRIGIIK